MKRRICVLTGTRAEYGLLLPVMRLLAADPGFELQVLATAAHLSPEFGETWRVIEGDGFLIDAKVEMLLSSDTGVGTAKSVALGLAGMADALDRLRPDLILVVGDRFEILAAAQAALFLRIPVGHIAGGDVTEGAMDESMRHAITKLAHLHFATNATAAARLTRMGERPERVFLTGSPGVDTMLSLTLLDRAALEQDLDFAFRTKNLLLTFHPETLAGVPATGQFQELLDALDGLGPEVGLLFTRPNADTEGRALNAMLDRFVATRPNARAYTSLGQLRYTSLMAQVDAVVGNSSSGLYETPTLKKPTVNIGDRQKGRERAASIIDCEASAAAIRAAIERALALDCSGVVNPYGDGRAAGKILDALKGIGDFQALVRKPFYDREG